jgi:integrase/recombinase XerC
MNTAITTSSAAITPASDLRPALFEEFITFIDRGEKTTRTYITNLRQFAAYLAYKRIARPQRQDVISYRDYLTAEHEAIQYNPATGWTYRTDRSGRRYTITCKPTTVKIYLQSVRQFFSWTAANGYYPDIAANIHAPKVRQDVHRKDALTAADVLTIEQSIAAAAGAKIEAAEAHSKDTAGRISRATEQGKRLFAMYTLAVNAGLRTIEISRANVRDLEVKSGRAVLYVWGKGHTEADAKKPLAPEVYEAIRDYLDSRGDRPTANSPLFVSTGNRSGGKRIAETTISKMLKQAMQQAGFNSDRITAHTLRHTAGTNVQEITGNLYITQKYMRHANPATTEIYLHNDTEKQETQTAQDLYNLYHGITAGDDREQLENLLQRMTPAQLSQLTGIAAAIAG